MSSTTALILLTVALLALVDFLPRLFVKTKQPTPVVPVSDRIPNYLIIPTVYGNISYLQNLSFLRKYANKVLIATSDHESDEFYRELKNVCRKEGFRYIVAEVPVAKNGEPVKNAYTIYAGVFKHLRSTYMFDNTPCILIDADTYATSNVNNLVRAFIKSPHHIASLRCEVAKPKTVIERLQAFEYQLAMDNRRVDTWLTSGACNIATARTYHRVFASHSGYFAGGDIEIGKIATVMGLNVGHIDFTFFTAAPSTFNEWFKQRVIWSAGGFRHHITNIGSYGWYHFFMLMYNSLIVYLLFPLRWIELVNYPQTMVALILISYIYLFFFSTKRKWKKEYFLLPVYSGVQSMIILPIAVYRYFTYVYNQRSLGVLKYNMSRFTLPQRLYFSLLNISSASVIVYLSVVITESRVDYWVSHGWLAALIG